MRAATKALVLAATTAPWLAASVALGQGSWEEPTSSVTIAGHFTQREQTNEGSTVIWLQHDGEVWLHPSAPEPGDEDLSCGTGDKLTTKYMLTGGKLDQPDQVWVPASTFVGGLSYKVNGSGRSDIILSVQGTSAKERLNDAGVYTATIRITITW